MEALVAVALAGNVLQFLQSAAKFIAVAKDIREKGHPSSLTDLRELSQTLIQQTHVIAVRLKANTATLEQEEQVRERKVVSCTTLRSNHV
jgi:hypothetical protein